MNAAEHPTPPWLANGDLATPDTARRPSSSAWPPLRAAWLVAICVAWLALTAWIRPLTAPDEGRYVGVALSMLHSGDWLVPRLDGLPFFHKPPLFYWISATAIAAATAATRYWAPRARPCP